MSLPNFSDHLAVKAIHSHRQLSAGACRFSAAARPQNRVVSSKRQSGELYLVWALQVFLVMILSISSSYASELPNFAKLVEEEGDAVVKISVVTGESANPATGLSPEQLEQLPEFMRRFYEPQRERRGSGFGSGFILSLIHI